MTTWTGKAYQALPSVTLPSVTSLWRGAKGNDDRLNLIACEDILKIGNALNSLPPGCQIDLPRLVVVGSQSSGKTSILNGLLAMDLLPTGADMVTRTPLHLQLIQRPLGGDGYCEFDHLGDNKFPLTMPRPTPIEVEAVRREIEKQTIVLAGKGMNVSHEAIHLRVYTPHVPNLSLYDLPGLTLVACTDKGQPADIKDQIRKMVGSHIKESRSLIMAVMPARADLQVDMALDLIKEYDPRLERTIGVLTKMDLLDAKTSMADYLRNQASVDLRPRYGYYAVRNRTPSDMESLDIFQGFEKEKEYFSSHPIYRDPSFTANLGLPALGTALSALLVAHLRHTLPAVIQEVVDRESRAREELASLGGPIPEDGTQRAVYVQKLLFEFSRRFAHAIEERSSTANVGRNMKQVFIRYRQDLTSLSPFGSTNFPDALLQETVLNCEGNHMSFRVPPIDVLEACMRDPTTRPLHQCLSPSLSCLQSVHTLLATLTESLLSAPEVARFPALTQRIKEIVHRDILAKEMDAARQLIGQLIEMEESYIWTDDKSFHDMLEGKSTMRQILQAYFDTVVATLSSSVPKAIMKALVLSSVRQVSPILLANLRMSQELLQEEPTQQARKDKCQRELKKLTEVRAVLDRLLTRTG